ncbi:SurA N-terminal domain-containing protein [Alteromonas sp. KUL49]|uniref:SurA N-terminal domain-containing protein n=1 Tax=Alteromonas sp. KUL49 TaxID=2480798 RepID=UPI00102F1A1E|nr:SurA N-terminal domain-containing protein [Alteromonas sp. KUL49]TAP39832.1 peptidylprolyl isomerase [Alteromonas sp. KUL49]GEA11842.1 peptidylprolyl isomerase [Alteromonas sp. KUL49]
MLERIREGSQGPWAMAVIVLIVLSFVFAGVGSYLTSSGSNAVASVNGDEISAQELERAYQNQRAQMEAQFGQAVGQLFSSEQYLSDFKKNVLDRLIAEKLIQQQAIEMGLRVSENQIRETILEMPEFQYAGQFDNERFQAILRQNGFTVTDFKDYLRTQMTQNQLAAAMNSSSFSLPSETELANALQQQTRDGKYLLVDASLFNSDVEVTEDEIAAYYDENIATFDTEEEVKLAYVMLSVNDLVGRAVVEDGDALTYYENNVASYSTEEERRVSHILVELGDDADAARARAEGILAKLNAGEDFAEVAKSDSDDTFSAESGGDLSFITKTDEVFEEAAFGIANVGEYTDIVETDFGLHIIQLTEIKPEDVTPFVDVEREITDTLLRDAALEEFYAQQTLMAELAFEVPDTLEDVANAVELPVVETVSFTRTTVPFEINVPAVVEAAFSSELVSEGVNSDLIELDDETVLVARVVEHTPQRTKALDEVSEEITAVLLVEKSQELARSWVSDLIPALVAGESVDAFLEEKSLVWEVAEGVGRTGSTINRSIVETLFTLALEGEKAYEVTSTSTGGVALVALTSVSEAAEIDEATQVSLALQLSQLQGQRVYEQYIDALRAQSDVKVLTAL